MSDPGLAGLLSDQPAQLLFQELLAVFCSSRQVAILHPQGGIRRLAFPGQSGFIENIDIPGSVLPGIFQQGGVGLETETPQVPKMFDPRVCQKSRRLFGRGLVIPLKDRGPQDKDLHFGVRDPLQDFKSFEGPSKTVGSSRRKHQDQAGTIRRSIESAGEFPSIKRKL